MENKLGEAELGQRGSLAGLSFEVVPQQSSPLWAKLLEGQVKVEAEVRDTKQLQGGNEL